MSFKIGVIGCGGFAEHAHGPTLASYAARHPEVELTACCDLAPERASAYARQFGFARSYADLEAMLDRESLDTVILLVAPAHTAAVAEPVLRRGLPLFLEKPPGLTSEELEHLIQLADLHGSPTQVAFNRRHMPLLRKAREILDRDFPPLMELRYELIRFDRRDADFSTTAIHAIDAARFLAGSPYRTASIQFADALDLPESGANATILAECESGLSVIIQIQPMAGLVSEAFSLHGVGASLVGQVFGPGSTQPGGSLSHWEDDHLKYSFSDHQLPFMERHGIYGELAAFCQAVQAGETSSPTLADCRQQVVLMESLRNRVSLPLDLQKFASPLCAA